MGLSERVESLTKDVESANKAYGDIEKERNDIFKDLMELRDINNKLLEENKMLAAKASSVNPLIVAKANGWMRIVKDVGVEEANRIMGEFDKEFGICISE